ncbi:UMP kinase [Halolamina sp. CBA1230]|uniref:UMP kinase n=1 Tax=Halolamina sp. CBA1230 TaxID=1853690 RepID=UPI0009A25324|nr:UMP kinase [Halolamina sp. CBA1230]QKY21052.1 UMP kinase [Halolamina sp. CBA1230]
MRVVVSIGGSVLAPGLDPERVEGFADALGTLSAEGCELGAVVGGGTVARQYIGAARDLAANEFQLDELGIGVTRLNARLLIAAMGHGVQRTPATSYDEAGEAIRGGDTVVMGGITPGQTTDAVAAALAEYIDAELLVFATSADGVYNADPETDDDAEQYGQLTPSELVEVIAPMDRGAGASAPVDLLAAKLIERSSLRTIVLDGTDPEAVVDAVLRGEHSGTDIVPTGGTDEPTYWTQHE